MFNNYVNSDKILVGFRTEERGLRNEKKIGKRNCDCTISYNGYGECGTCTGSAE